MSIETDAADLQGPRGGTRDDGSSRISNITVTTGSVPHDLSDATAHFGMKTAAYIGVFVRLRAITADVSYFFSDDPAAVVDAAAVDGTNRARQCDLLTAAEGARQERISGRYLVVKGSVGGFLRIVIVQSDKPVSTP